MVIKVLGSGCARCKQLEKLTRKAVEEGSIEATVTKVEDIAEIMRYGVMVTPALVVNEKVVSKGVIPSVSEIIKILNDK
jgi:small redox-active disulfide protein 2